ncbi:hypothetical protein EVAR_19700_1 [Eumeta japonica]|uniref:Uncharacterized protein n=1 Tax=Eumeta variegata TaxID=151549 RepID=A0A4C1V207_EUMVA|nr:hypothetical protein EVAR_19700_1 [Eumeta japonica]
MRRSLSYVAISGWGLNLNPRVGPVRVGRVINELGAAVQLASAISLAQARICRRQSDVLVYNWQGKSFYCQLGLRDLCTPARANYNKSMERRVAEYGGAQTDRRGRSHLSVVLSNVAHGCAYSMIRARLRYVSGTVRRPSAFQPCRYHESEALTRHLDLSISSSVQ